MAALNCLRSGYSPTFYYSATELIIAAPFTNQIVIFVALLFNIYDQNICGWVPA